MKSKFLYIAIAVLFLFSSCQKREIVLISGSGFKKIVALDKASKQFVWEHDLQARDECNQVNYTADGNVLYAHKNGASLINENHEVLWHLKADDQAEIQSASITSEGNFLIGQCGNPAKIMEFTSVGEKLLEIHFQPEQKRPHGQFRRVMKQAPDFYFVILLNGTILKLNQKGLVLEEHKVADRAFDLEIVNESCWLVSCGDSHKLIEYNPITKKSVTPISRELPGNVKLKYVAEVVSRGDGVMIANWGGHEKNSEAQPQLIELDENYNIVWQLKDETLGNISAISFK